MDAEEDEVIIDIESDPRHGLQVRRYHTWRTIQTQSVGEHSAQIMRIMLTVWPDVPRHLLVHAVLHDVGEMAGDLPYPVKRNDPELKSRMSLAELRVHRMMTEKFMLPPPVQLSEQEERFFKFCEYLEMWEHCLQERNLGNKYATVMHVRMLMAASTLMGRLAPDVQVRARRYVELREEQESEFERLVPSDPSEEAMVVQDKREKQA
jgi:5'-deoxynucleotidase YfbR-like HD superfamily hydrolase